MSINIKSTSNNVFLSLTLFDPDYLEVKIAGNGVKLCHTVFIYTDFENLKLFLSSLGQDYRRKDEEIRWSSIEEDFILYAVIKSSGHIILRVEVIHGRGSDEYWEYKTYLKVDPSELIEL